MEIFEFRTELLQEIENNSTINLTDDVSEFIAAYTALLIDIEEILDVDLYDVEVMGPRNRRGRIDGITLDESDNTLRLFISDFSGAPNLESLSTSDANKAAKRAINFLEFSMNDYIADSCEESSQANQAAMILKELFNNTYKIIVYILTDKELSRDLNVTHIEKFMGREIEVRIYDIVKFYNNTISSKERENLEINIPDFEHDGIYAVKALESVEEQYSSYLGIINGDLLAKLYMKYGSRLLEGNVRSFLSVRGKINQGIRNTIRNDPELFFAYNNGIAATATDIEFEETEQGLLIKKLTDFQIINGGQTTASIANAVIKDKLMVDRVQVPIKLSVLTNEKANDMIPNIARYANSQNKVEESDFFSNSPFHRRIEELSRRIMAPAKQNEMFETVWYYERAKGQYTQEQMKLSTAQTKQFKKKFPKNQVIKKVQLAKYLMTYERKPHIVSKGNQYNMREFSKIIEKNWEKNENDFNKYYFQKMIAISIMFKETEKLVASEEWYKEIKAYRMNIVTYSLALIFEEVEKLSGKGLGFDYLRVWKNQDLYPELYEQIRILTYEVFKFITRDDRLTLNVTEWCKKKICWERALKEQWNFTTKFLGTLISKNEEKSREDNSKKEQKQLAGIEAQSHVINMGSAYWKEGLDYGTRLGILTEADKSFLSTALDFSRRIPSDKQCAKICVIEEKLKNEGYILG